MPSHRANASHHRKLRCPTSAGNLYLSKPITPLEQVKGLPALRVRYSTSHAAFLAGYIQGVVRLASRAPPRFRHIEGNPPWSSSIPFSSRSWRLAAHLVNATDSDTASITATATATAGTSTPTTKEAHLQLHLAADQEPITPKPRSSQQLILLFYQLCRASALPTTPPLNHVGGQ